MTSSIGSLPLLHADVKEQRSGAWTADVEVDALTPPSGTVTLNVEGVTFLGTIVRGDVYAGRAHLKLVGGKGGLGKLVDARYYNASIMQAVLADLMGEIGETLSPTTDAAVLSRSVPRWSRTRGPAGLALQQIATECGVSWRVLRDGTIWLGAETWPAATATVDETNRDPKRGTSEIAPDAPLALLATTFNAKQVSQVTTSYSPGSLRQQLYFEDASSAPSPFDRIRQTVAALIESMVGRRIDYSQMFPATVVQQDADGTLHVYADDPRIRGNGITHVPMRHGIPGCTVLVTTGQRVNVFFENGDPKSPAAALWPDGSSVSSVTWTLGSGLTIAGDVTITGALNVHGEVAAHSASSPVHLTTHVHPTALGPSRPPTPGS